ncbi:MAG: hypothetical protein EWV45_04665 [Microcystis flos-aquae Mf_QC_C_20070823_S10D]|jgi:hypothetical protein|uniref:Uncharacterized protein n=1 Tax=Microcystis flos-aquae Mf_QC_C_20070823_S10D TaxID=2486236 RepID=A0A552L3N2_9CHRO|nr:MAG: hypothetical protein EWV65_05110 [Microcystis flos-aquae Ma_QC_C_20070823_S18D]TRV14834.1 MAG: hypothetical protein EWV45_04665 [Microcystis flos-aquae Mf_QC_C_20070823_S10D]TRV18822.1 MAG: hypothetical protein EWV72_23070 [Microcystis flos-aquae Mf_QC_C_20070823_S10]TRV33526.1 MAG: hypothetical protein EWV71_16295 [Microcystis flos-aquae Mf_QC_C_20070823_S20D]TRV38096.1 MAG: hypothetical protein EWV70_05625 [Microcystis flos-aquae Mf_QC_C_20070823_S20]TRV39308.1 MAG: hypothetical prot
MVKYYYSVNNPKYLSKINYTYLTTSCLFPIFTRKSILHDYLAVPRPPSPVSTRKSILHDYLMSLQMYPFLDENA